MRTANYCGVVEPTMVALREHIDEIDAAGLQGVLKLALIEAGADIREMFGGMEIEMNLSR